MEPLKVALLGCGVVGTEVARLLAAYAGEHEHRVGVPLQLVGIGVRRPGRARDVDVDPALFTTDAAGLVRSADIVIEVIGGIEPARGLVLDAMAHGASVVTANKALLAEDGPTLYTAADKHGVDLYYEASVAGAIPLHPPAARVAGRRPDHPHPGHRQRDHQLRAGPDGQHRSRFCRGGTSSPGPRVRRG